MVRGLAALAVCLGHARAFLLVDYAESGGGALATLFYFAVGLHVQAVTVFFVLSGFLVGGSVLRARAQGKWSWGGYLLRRLTRLWVVIVPALLLTLFWDLLGGQANPAGYAGAWYARLSSGPVPGVYDLSPANFVANLLFLQNFATYPYGSNTPMWSLSSEFVYYLMFPLAVQALVSRESRWMRAAAAAAVVALAILMPRLIIVGGLVWLFGVVAFAALNHAPTARAVARWPVALAGFAAMAAVLVVGRGQWSPGFDVLLGVSFGATVPWLARAAAPWRWYRRVALALSELSYTLYLVHFPLLAWLYFAVVGPDQWRFGAAGVALYAAVVAGVLVYAAAIWWLFERNTDRVRAFLVRRLAARAVAA